MFICLVFNLRDERCLSALYASHYGVTGAIKYRFCSFISNVIWFESHERLAKRSQNDALKKKSVEKCLLFDMGPMDRAKYNTDIAEVWFMIVGNRSWASWLFAISHVMLFCITETGRWKWKWNNLVFIAGEKRLRRWGCSSCRQGRFTNNNRMKSDVNDLINTSMEEMRSTMGHQSIDQLLIDWKWKPVGRVASA